MHLPGLHSDCSEINNREKKQAICVGTYEMTLEARSKEEERVGSEY
jgi:hypothetical protein